MLEILYFFQRFFPKGSTFFNAYNFFTEIILNIFYKSFYEFLFIIFVKKGIKNKSSNEPQIIVSMTTYPKRINDVSICIESIMNQKTKANRIILWLAESQFEDKKILPKHLLHLETRGLEIKFCDDLRSHKKYYYAIKNNPDDIVITLDDDCYYPNFTIQRLIELNKVHPDKIICNKSRKIDLRSEKIPSYTSWETVNSKEVKISTNYVPIGVGGVLYPPYSLSSMVFNKDDIKNICFNTDDLWLKVHSLIKETKVVYAGYFPELFSIGKTQKNKLSLQNWYENRNDIELNNILVQYKGYLKK